MTDLNSARPPANLPLRRILGLDAVRAVCALWVAMGHLNAPPVLIGIDRESFAGWVCNALYNNLINGPAAVIVFFVISGICIHYPYSQSLSIPSLVEYAVRRYLRVGIPLAAAACLSPFLGIKLNLFHDSILWSLAAELIYYTLYPLFLVLRRSGVSWRAMIAVGFLVAMGLAATNPTAGNYPSWGVWLNWILGLPCWLVGCQVAEYLASDCTVPVSGQGMAAWRWTIFGTSVILSVLRYHTPLGYPWTLNLFAILVGVWLVREAIWCRTHAPSALLEWVGKWSYSIYLIHMPGFVVYRMVDWPNLGHLLNWTIQMAVVLSVCYAFYLLVEYPSHLLARRLGRMVSQRAGGALQSAPA